jgi:glycosyltransferase involved in cell wall biosynthesis
MIEREHLVSVILPTYYRNDALSGAIESVFQQTHNPVELIVVDDSGEAHAKPVVERFDDLTYVPLEENRGAQGARNAGLELASGEYVQFMDDDDRLHPEKFTKQVPELTADVGVVYAGFEIIETGEVHSPKPGYRGDVLREAVRMRLYPCSNCTMLMDASALNELAPLDNEHAADDLDLMIQLAKRTRFEYVDEPLSYVREEMDDSLGKSWANLRARKHVVEKHADIYDRFPAAIKRQTLSDIYRLEAQMHMDERAWSPQAIAAFGRSAAHARADKVGRTVEFLSSFFGDPGLAFAQQFRRLCSRYLIKDN